jgi:excisionase family DNA binding protein
VSVLVLAGDVTFPLEPLRELELVTALRDLRRYRRTNGSELPAWMNDLERTLIQSVSDSVRQKRAPGADPVTAAATVDDMEHTTTGAAAVLGVCARTVERWIRNGKLDATKDATGRWRIPGSEIDRLANRKEAA